MNTKCEMRENVSTQRHFKTNSMNRRGYLSIYIWKKIVYLIVNIVQTNFNKKREAETKYNSPLDELYE